MTTTQVCPGHEYQRKLHPDDQPLRAKLQRDQRGEQCHFIVRRNPHYPRRKQILAPINENHTPTTTCNNQNPITSSQHSLHTADTGTSTSSRSTAPPLAAPEKLATTAKPTSSSLQQHDEPYAGAQLNGGICKMCKNHFRSCDFCNTSARPMPAALAPCGGSGTPALLKTLPQPSPSSTSHLNNNHPSNNRQYHYYISRHSICGNVGMNEVGGGTSGASSTGIGSEYQLPPVTHSHNDYSPVYNVREIRSVCHSFSALGIDKKLRDGQRQRNGSMLSLGASAAAAVQHSADKRTPENDQNSNMSVDTSTASATSNDTMTMTTSTSTNSTINASNTSTAANSAPTIHSSGSGIIMEAVYNDPANGFGKFVYI